MKNVMASVGLVALGAFGVENAHAQMTLTGPDKPYTLSGTLRGFYDSNYDTAPKGTSVFQNSDGTFSTNKNVLSSFGFEIKPSISAKFILPQSELRLAYLMDMRYYSDRPRNNADYSHDFETYFSHSFNERYSMEVSDGFVIAQEPELVDPSNNSQTVRVNGNNLRNTGAINFHAKASDELSFVFSYANTLYSYDQNAHDLGAAATNTVSRSGDLDRIEQTASVTARYLVNRQTTAIFGYQFSQVGFTSDEIIGTTASGSGFTSSVRDNYSHYVYTGLDHTFLPELSASLRIGLQYTDYYNDPSSSTALGPYVDLSTSYNYMDGGYVTLGFTHRRNTTDLLGNAATKQTMLSQLTLDQESSTIYLSLSQKLTPKITGTLTGHYQSSVFNGGSVASGGAGGETDQFFLLGVNLMYQFNRFLSGEVGYNYDNLSSDLAERSYDRSRVYLGITGTY